MQLDVKTPPTTSPTLINGVNAFTRLMIYGGSKTVLDEALLLTNRPLLIVGSENCRCVASR